MPNAQNLSRQTREGRGPRQAGRQASRREQGPHHHTDSEADEKNDRQTQQEQAKAVPRDCPNAFAHQGRKPRQGTAHHTHNPPEADKRRQSGPQAGR